MRIALFVYRKLLDHGDRLGLPRLVARLYRVLRVLPHCPYLLQLGYSA